MGAKYSTPLRKTLAMTVKLFVVWLQSGLLRRRQALADPMKM